MDLVSLQQHLQLPNLAPVEQWQPSFCGDLPLRIDSQGRWWYQNGEISRPGLIKLFASVLLYQDGEYFLQTPVEKVRIQVEDVPFLVVNSHWVDSDLGPELWLTTNVQDSVPVSAIYPLVLKPYEDQLLPYLQLWRGLSARMHRNLYYHLLQHAELEQNAAGVWARIFSGGKPYLLGQAE